MRRLLLAGAVLVAVAGGALAVWLYPSSGDDASSGEGAPSSHEIEGEPAGGSHDPPRYDEPVQLTDGDYMPPSFPYQQVAEEGIARLEEEKAAYPVFEGTVNGVRLYSFEHSFADPSVEKRRCKRASFEPLDMLKLDYLPPGTFADTPVFAGLCEDGSVGIVMQSLTTHHATFDVIYEPGEAAFGHDAPADRVSTATVAGRHAVIVHPIMEEGFGRSWIGAATENGLLLVDARDLPVEQTLKIAEGVQCAVC